MSPKRFMIHLPFWEYPNFMVELVLKVLGMCEYHGELGGPHEACNQAFLVRPWVGLESGCGGDPTFNYCCNITLLGTVIQASYHMGLLCMEGTTGPESCLAKLCGECPVSMWSRRR